MGRELRRGIPRRRFMQGLTVGTLVEGLWIASGHYIGGDLGRLSAFALLCGVGLRIGYALLGTLLSSGAPIAPTHWSFGQLVS